MFKLTTFIQPEIQEENTEKILFFTNPKHALLT